MGDAAAVVVVATAPRPGLCKPGLEALLGRDGCARLQAALVRRATAWAAEVGDPYLAFEPADARAEMAALAPAGTTLIEQGDGSLGDRLGTLAAQVLDDHGGPVLLVGVDTPQLRPEVGFGAVDDLRSGVDVTIGPATDGAVYLVGLREPHPEVFDLPGDVWGGPTVLERSLARAHEAGLSLGMLRAERHLDGEADVRALLADPLAPAKIVALLRKE